MSARGSHTATSAQRGRTRTPGDDDDDTPSRTAAALPACPPVRLTPEEQAALKAAPVIVAQLEGGAHRVRVVRRVRYELVLAVVDGRESGGAQWIDASRLEEEP